MTIKNIEIQECYVCGNLEEHKETCYFCKGSGKMLEITTVSHQGLHITDKTEIPSIIKHILKNHKG